MSYTRGDVVVATDPFTDDDTTGRPFLVVNRPEMPFHGEQYVCLSLTTRTWYDERLPLTADDWVDGGAPESSSIMPWSVNSVKDEWTEFRQGTLRDGVVERAAAEFTRYVV